MPKKAIARVVGVDPKTMRSSVAAAERLGLVGLLDDDGLARLGELRIDVVERPHGEARRRCEEQRNDVRNRLDDGAKLTRVRKLLERCGVLVPYPTLHRCAAEELGFGRRRHLWGRSPQSMTVLCCALLPDHAIGQAPGWRPSMPTRTIPTTKKTPRKTVATVAPRRPAAPTRSPVEEPPPRRPSDRARAEALARALAGDAPTATAGVPRFRVKALHRLPNKTWGGLVTQIVVAGDDVTLIGGGGQSLWLESKDAGKTFAPRGVKVGQGLRFLLRDGKATWVCGQYGMVARAQGRSRVFTKVDVGATSCMQTLLRADGALWATGDSGAFRSTDDGATWTKVRVPGEIARPRDSVHGVLLPSDQGQLFLGNAGRVWPTSMTCAAPLWAATATTTGTIIAVGGPQGGVGAAVVLRSDDGGQTSTAIDVGLDVGLENVVCTPSGRVFAVGKNGTILCSTDDGLSFFALPHTFRTQWLFSLTTVGERVYTAGLGGVVLTIDEVGKRARRA